jgi:hypothetical protein
LVLDFRNLTRGELIAGLAGVALFVIMLAVDWYGLNVLLLAEGDPDPDVVQGNVARGEGAGLNWVEGPARNAFEAFTVIDLILLLTALAAVALPLWSALGRPAIGPHQPGEVVAALGAVAFVLIAFRLIDLPDLEIPIAPGVPDPPEDIHVSDTEGLYEATRKVGPWLGLVAAGFIMYGGYLSMRHPVSAPGEDAPLPPREPLETA